MEFDLKKYLIERKLTKASQLQESAANSLYKVYKLTLKETGDTIYARTIISQGATPEAYLSKQVKVLSDHLRRSGKAPSRAAELIISNPDISSWKFETMGDGLSEEEAADLRVELVKQDPKTVSTVARGATSRRTVETIKVPKSESISLGGKVFVKELYLQRNPEFAKRVKKILAKVTQDIPGKGAYRELISQHVTRV